LVPIITTPYLARVLEVENFGLLEVASAIVGYVSLVSDWGFGYTATRDVVTRRRSGGTPIGSLESGSPEGLALRRLARRLSNRYFSYPSMAQYGSKFYWCIPCRPSPPFSGLGGSLQGLEKMVGFAAVSLIGRLANVPISVIASLVMANRALPLLPIPFQFEGAWQQIKAGSPVFLSTGGIMLLHPVQCYSGWSNRWSQSSRAL
jgi:hypothetical protein